MDPDLQREWAEADGHHPGVNSRIRIGGAGAVMQVLDETSFTTEMDCRLNPAYGDLIERADIPFICLTTLIREPDVQIGLAVMRGRAQGNIEAEDRRAFQFLAGRARQAVLTTLTLGRQAAQSAVWGLGGLGLSAFICDCSGRVLATTDTEAALTATGDRLKLRCGRLYDRVSGCDLSDRARAAAREDSAALSPLILRGTGADDDLVMEFAALPSETTGFPGAPGALIVVRRAWGVDTEGRARRIAALYRLTPRESQIAACLCRGLSPQKVGLKLGMAIGTVRTHIRHLFDKTDVTTLAQLVALLRAYDV